MNRKHFIQKSALASAGLLFSKFSTAALSEFPTVRIPESERKFTSLAVENVIQTVQKKMANKELAWLFGNCFPNTLDTTVNFETINGKPDSYVITGDIDAMWLRDSTAQVWPYLPLVNQDPKLKLMIEGVIRRHVKCILLDPYANAFYKDPNRISEWKDDITKMKPGIHERKWEIDSLCYVIRLAHGYWKQTGDISAFDADWREAMRLIIQTFKEQQRIENQGPYSFMRTTSWASDGVVMSGFGYRGNPNGLICSTFRSSDDATIFPYIIPGNFFAHRSLIQLKEMAKAIKMNEEFNKELAKLYESVSKAVNNVKTEYRNAKMPLPYEINGWGSKNMMDDGNVPSLVALPYLDTLKIDDPMYIITRKFVFSTNNPFYFEGKLAKGVGSPHTGADLIWPMGLVVQALTSTSDSEIKYCLKTLQNTHAKTGFMHESFNKDDDTKFTRKWFAWANTIFGELIWKLYREKPHLLN